MLDKIKNPADVKKLSIPHLGELADEVRARIIEVTAQNGGHIAPSLGATDLAISVLKIFDPLKDRIVWDVGHQSYAYKILTGRNEEFSSLRQFQGLSGFNKIAESKYDAFGVGHASTSISAALGIATAKKMQGDKHHAIAIIGDGALTGGVALEALNHAGDAQLKNLIVILNDNAMSISKSVGAMQASLTNLLVSRSYNFIRKIVWKFVQFFPYRIRRRLIMSARRLEENMVNTLAPETIFEGLGFKYVGPIDGHSIPRLVKILRKAKQNVEGPILLHVVTRKGKGYKPAESDACRFHGLGPFEVESGKSVSQKSESYSNIFGNKLIDLARKDDKIVAITAAMTAGTGLTDFAAEFPDRLFDVGIAEQHALTFAAGLVTEGIKPFVAIYSTFTQRAFDQLIHDVALQNLPIVLCLDRAGLVGDDGATHHGVFDLSYLNLIPNWQILAPANAEELQEMMEYAADYDKGPIAIRYPRGSALHAKQPYQKFVPGKFEIVQTGKQVALIGVGKAFARAEYCAKMLQEKYSDFTPTLINARTVKPVDEASLENLEADYIFTFEDNALIGGFGSTIKSYFADKAAKVYSFGIPDRFIEHGEVALLEKANQLSAEQIWSQIEKILPYE
ncbi:MAG: 1-deoxy-D-xylulose-5-phosphate synthase [Candidatus Cloacimonadales bacterium]